MAETDELTKGLGDAVRQGLGVFGQGVNTIAQVLRSGDAALREVDGALTGGTASAAPGSSRALGPEQQLAQRVVSLVNQGGEAAKRAGDPKTPTAIARFQETMRLLFQQSFPVEAGLSDLMPSPSDVLRMALKNLRGSMALVRLANGAGSVEDVEEVARFAEELAEQLQPSTSLANTTMEPTATRPEIVQPPAAKPTKTRAKGTGRGKKKKEPPNPSAVAFARAMGEEMGDATVKRWAEDLAAAKITEDQFIDRWSKKAGQGKSANPETLLARAKQRAIEAGLPADDPYLQGL